MTQYQPLSLEHISHQQSLNLLPQLFARVLGIQFRQFAQNLLRLFIAHIGRNDLYFHNLVAARAFLHSRWHSLLAQTQLLSALRSRRNLQQSAAIDRRYFDLPAQAGFRETDWNREINVVAVALEDGMLARAHDDVEIACGCAHRAGIAAARKTNALTVARASLDADLERLGALHAALAVTHVAHRAVLAAAAAARARHVELHAAALLRNLSFPFAFRADAWTFDVAVPMTGPADLEVRDIELHHRASDRIPEADIYLVFEVAARLGTLLHRLAASTAEDAGKDVAEAAATGPATGRARSF